MSKDVAYCIVPWYHVFEIWTFVWRKLKWRHHNVIIHSNFMKFHFYLIRHKRAEIYSRGVHRELWRKKEDIESLWPCPLSNFNRVWASVVCNRLSKTASKSVHLFGWNFVHKQSRTNTHTQTLTQTNCSENITPPRFRGDVKRNFIKQWSMIIWFQTNVKKHRISTEFYR